MENNQVVVPDGIKKWNWGAFAFTFFWGIGNQVYISLLCLIPFVNIVMIFVLGAKGNEWAWKNNNYRDVEEFQKTQSTWNRAGLVWFIVTVIIVVIYIIMMVTLGVAFMNQYVPGTAGSSYY